MKSIAEDSPYSNQAFHSSRRPSILVPGDFALHTIVDGSGGLFPLLLSSLPPLRPRVLSLCRRDDFISLGRFSMRDPCRWLWSDRSDSGLNFMARLSILWRVSCHRITTATKTVEEQKITNFCHSHRYYCTWYTPIVWQIAAGTAKWSHNTKKTADWRVCCLQNNARAIFGKACLLLLYLEMKPWDNENRQCCSCLSLVSLLQRLMLVQLVPARRVAPMLYVMVWRRRDRLREPSSSLKFKGHQSTLFIWADGSVGATGRERDGDRRRIDSRRRRRRGSGFCATVR